LISWTFHSPCPPVPLTLANQYTTLLSSHVKLSSNCNLIGMIRLKHSNLAVFIVVVVSSSYICSAAKLSPPPDRRKPDYCKKKFDAVAVPTAGSFIFSDGLKAGSAFSFGLGLFLPPNNQSVGNVYGQGTVIVVSLSGTTTSPGLNTPPQTSVVSFVNFNVVSPVGQIASQGIWDDKLNATCSFPVTGGTGVYTGAAGALDMLVIGPSTYLFSVTLTKASC
ncbi:hypothetical protein VaNZ11_016641, partial [Volvox africanus]